MRLAERIQTRAEGMGGLGDTFKGYSEAVRRNNDEVLTFSACDVEKFGEHVFDMSSESFFSVRNQPTVSWGP